MEPEGFEWHPAGPGVTGKVLGRFTSGDVYIANYRWTEPGGVLTLGPERTQLLWIADGELSVNGVGYDPATVIFSDFEEATELAGTAGAQAVVFGLALPAAVPA
jgi:hypothetical protein